MKSFSQFSESVAVQQATRMGLKSDGHGGWYDKKGEFVAKTERGVLKFFNKRERVGQQDPPQTDKEKKLSAPSSEPAPQQQEPVQEPKVMMEPPEVEKTKGTLTIAFGRFNPPTTGHGKLLDTVASNSDEGDYVIVPSRSQDKKKNPLDADTKIAVMQKMFPNHKDKIVNDQANRTIFDVLKKAHTDGYSNVRILGGADRVNEYEKLANNYNGKLYAFDNVEVMSAGERDPDSDDVTGMSASKQRKAAAEGDIKAFMNKEGAIAGMLAGIGITLLYVFQHKGIMFIQSTSFLGGMDPNWFFGIEPNAFGAVGAMVNFCVASVVSRKYADIPLDVEEMIVRIRRP